MWLALDHRVFRKRLQGPKYPHHLLLPNKESRLRGGFKWTAQFKSVSPETPSSFRVWGVWDSLHQASCWPIRCYWSWIELLQTNMATLISLYGGASKHIFSTGSMRQLRHAVLFMQPSSKKQYRVSSEIWPLVLLFSFSHLVSLTCSGDDTELLWPSWSQFNLEMNLIVLKHLSV